MADQASSGVSTLLWTALIGVLLGVVTTWVAHLAFEVPFKAGILFVGASLLIVSVAAFLSGRSAERRKQD